MALKHTRYVELKVMLNVYFLHAQDLISSFPNFPVVMVKIFFVLQTISFLLFKIDYRIE